MSKLTSWAVLLPIFSASTFAATSAADSNETLVITANRFEQPVSSVLAPFTIIERDEIEASQAKSVVDILRFLPGVDISQSGGRGQQASIYIRGTNSAHTLVLLDGVKINAATDGAAQVAHIPAAVVERVEYVRGARAALYGADAIGGVINIITTPDEQRSKAQLEAGVGGDGYDQASLRSYAQFNENTSTQLTVNHEHSDGYNVKVGSHPDDEHGYQMTNLVAGVNHRWNKYLQAEIRGLLDQGYSEYDQWALYRSEHDNSMLQGKLHFNTESYRSVLALSKNSQLSEHKPVTAENVETTFATIRENINWINAFDISQDALINVGAEWEQEDVAKSSSAYLNTSRINRALFTTANLEWQPVTLEGSLRYDNNESYGENSTYSLAGAWQFMANTQMMLSYGTAFKAPSFNDLYGPWGGNPNLKAQDAQEGEIGFQGNVFEINWQLNAYQTDIQDMIIWYDDGPNGSWYPANVDAKIKGLELDTQFDTGFIEHSLNATLMDPRDTKGKLLARRAKGSASWKGRVEFDQWDIVLAALYKGKRYSNPSNTVELSPYTLLDFAISYHPIDSVTVSGRIDNLLDEDYETSENYKTQERIWYLSVKYNLL